MPPKSINRHIIFQLKEIKNKKERKQKVLKETTGGKHNTHTAAKIGIVSDFSSETMQARRERSGILKVLR